MITHINCIQSCNADNCISNGNLSIIVASSFRFFLFFVSIIIKSLDVFVRFKLCDESLILHVSVNVYLCPLAYIYFRFYDFTV